MKKSFMTRVLATGLSLAMAFSLTAATNVTVASAASTPAMASKQFAVRVGGAAKSYKASAATQKSYKISKATVGNTDKATVKVNSSKKSIKVTPGTVTGSTVVKISFKNIKTKKTTSKKYRCVVKAAVVEKQAIVKAEATGVKTITLTMAKDVASVESPVAITVKKGTSDRPCKATAEGKTITLAMDAKLMAGDYFVTIKGLETEDLTATVNVEKEETLDHYEISKELISVTNVRTSAYFYYSARNQYGERMVAADPNASCSFGNTHMRKSATATADGIIDVYPINEVLAINGTTGTVVLVDPTVGVTSTATVTYSAPATAKEVEIAGTYNVNKAKFQNITAGEKINTYELLLTAKDQYGNALDDNAFNSALDTTKKITISLVGGLTHVTTKTNYDWKARTIDGVDYIAVELDKDSTSTDGLAVAGSAQYTIVNPSYGLLKSDSLVISDRKIIKSFTISADNGLYESEDNELSFEAIDTEGNSITDYATLYELVKVKADSDTSKKYMKWVRKSDGSAKLIYNPGDLNLTPAAGDETIGKMDIKHSTVVTRTVYCNEQTSSNYLVKTFTMTAKQKRFAQTITGLKADTVTAVSTTAGDKRLEIKTEKFLQADQYGNSLNKDNGQFVKLLADGFAEDDLGKNSVLVGQTSTNTNAGGANKLFQSHENVETGSVISVYIETNAAFDSYSVTTAGSIVMTASGIAGSNTVYVKLVTRANLKDNNDNACSKSNYDYKFTVTATGTDDLASSSAKVDSVYGGYAIAATANTAVEITTPSVIKVKAMAAGQLVDVPTAQWKIIGYENNKITNDDVAKGINEKEATVKIRVTTWDKTGAPVETDIDGKFKIAIADTATLYKVTGTIAGGKKALTATRGGIATVDTFGAFFYGTDKHGTDVSQGATESSKTLNAFTQGEATFTIEAVEMPAGARQGIGEDFVIWNSGTTDAQIKFGTSAKTGDYKFTVKATTKEGTEKSVTFTFRI